jgi:hypothetical protein
MPAWVGMSVGAVRCQSGRVASHVRGMWAALRGSGLQIVALAMRHNVEHIRRQGFETQMLVYFRKFNRNTKAESLHFCPAFVYALLAVVLFVKRINL